MSKSSYLIKRYIEYLDSFGTDTYSAFVKSLENRFNTKLQDRQSVIDLLSEKDCFYLMYIVQ